MTKWIPCGPNFAMGDVIRWVEPVWKPRESKCDKAEKIGYRLVEAQVMRCDPEWAVLEVRPDGCKMELLPGWKVEDLPNEIKRRRSPIGAGMAERYGRSDEPERSRTASRFLNDPPEPVIDAVPRARAPSPSNWPPRLRDGGAAKRGHGRGRKGPRPRPKR